MKNHLFGILTFLSFSAFAQIPNNGLEFWGSTFGAQQDPINYVSENVYTSFAVNTANPTSVTEIVGGAQYLGNKSAKIKTVKVITNPAPTYVPDTVGVLMLGVVSASGNPPLKSGAPWTIRLGALEFRYQYYPVNNDNGAVASYLTKWNGISRDTLAEAIVPLTTTINSWTAGSATYVYDGAFSPVALPDSIHVYMLSSARPWLTTVPSYAQLGSELWIDELIGNPVGLNESIPLNPYDVIAYPNPTSNTLNFSTNNEKAAVIELYNVEGKLVSKQNFESKNIKIETNSFSNGVYFYNVKDADGKILKSGKVSVSK